jgi:hypothetical protein
MRATEKEIELIEKELEGTLLAKENRHMTKDLGLLSPKMRGWLENKQAIIRAHDVYMMNSCCFICNLCTLQVYKNSNDDQGGQNSMQ